MFLFHFIHLHFLADFSSQNTSRLHQKNNIQGGRYQLIRRLTIRHVLCGGLVVLAVFYLFYLLRLDSQTQDILHQLNKLLR